ncbi:hypothetical protein OHA77_15960 [Streptosporangium sp. NBC_01639]|uniref:hypothetical protein n=1 Tax=Streptosporangium sp. NBC_01639 TaxID=2975948 RepID=UPI003869AA9C|nr:hypothetical protein OHA77_15960 [Streptosporangium sp. NBC_01639]
MTALPDPAETASGLEADHPGWVVLWRCWARRFWAFPCWVATDPEPVEAARPHDLLTLMEEVELRHQPPAGHPYPPIQRGGRQPAA